MQQKYNNTPGSSISILAATWRDLSAIQELDKLSFPLDAWPLIDMIGVLTFPNVVRFKATDGNRLVGFIAADIRRSKDTAWIATIAVHPDYRKQGIGSRLLEACEKRLDIARIRLTVRKSNRTAIELYNKHGYVQTTTWLRYYIDGEDGLVMEKYLST
jgi:ribosomal-protein-alanine N-acetyltransferase